MHSVCVHKAQVMTQNWGRVRRKGRQIKRKKEIIPSEEFSGYVEKYYYASVAGLVCQSDYRTD